MPNLFANLPDSLPEEFFETLLEGSSVRIERIVSRGHCSPPGFCYDQETHEWVIVLRGSATLSFPENETTVALGPGDYVNIPAHQKHRVESTADDEPTVWLAVHYK